MKKEDVKEVKKDVKEKEEEISLSSFTFQGSMSEENEGYWLHLSYICSYIGLYLSKEYVEDHLPDNLWICQIC